jgi:hypothetical protein
VWVRKAAAAAADERTPLVSWSRTKALVAARAADELGGGALEACIEVRLASLSSLVVKGLKRTHGVRRGPLAVAKHGESDVT